jgi:Domain of unknown function (DUF4372)/Transposase DDE domain
MNDGKYVFSQVMSFVSHNEFNRCVEQYEGNRRVRQFSCWNQFLCMAFGQLTHRESLSDTVLCLNSNSGKLYHMGIGRLVTKTTLSRANENRDWRIYADFALSLIDEARRLYGSDSQLEIELKQNVFAIDATVIDLCLNVYSWAKFRKSKAAVKLHVQLDLKNSIPCFIHITTGKVHEVNVLDLIDFETDGFYIMDRGYKDFARLYNITLSRSFFVTRALRNLDFRRVYSSPGQTNRASMRPGYTSCGLLCRQAIPRALEKNQILRRRAGSHAGLSDQQLRSRSTGNRTTL